MDGKQALAQACQEAFPNAVGLFCLTKYRHTQKLSRLITCSCTIWHLVVGVTRHFTDRGLRSILEKVFSKHHISSYKVNIPPVGRGSMSSFEKNVCKSDWLRQQVLEGWTNSDMN